MVRVTPIDIQQMGFKIRFFRGYDRQEVDTFLDMLTEDYEALFKKNSTMQDQIADLEDQVGELKKKEASLNNMLIQAQDMVEQMHHNAQKEAELIIKEAEIRAEELIRTAREEVSGIQREILDAEKQKVIFLEKIQSLIRIFQKLVESETEQDLHKQSESDDEQPRLSWEKQDDSIRVLRSKP